MNYVNRPFALTILLLSHSQLPMGPLKRGPAGAHHRVRREPVGGAGGQHDGTQQGLDRVSAYVRDGD